MSCAGEITRSGRLPGGFCRTPSHQPMQHGPNGTLVPVTEGSTRPVFVAIHSAGATAIRRQVELGLKK